MATAGEGKGDDEEPRTYIARREVKVPCGLEIVVDKIAKYEGCSGKRKKREGDEAWREGGAAGERRGQTGGSIVVVRFVRVLQGTPVPGMGAPLGRAYVAWRGRQHTMDCQGNLLGIYGRASSMSPPGRS